MKFGRNVLYIVLLAALSAFVALSVYVNFFAKDRIVQSLTAALGGEVSIREVGYRFPFGLQASGVKIGDALEAGEAIVTPALPVFTGREIRIAKIALHSAKITIHKASAADAAGDGAPEAKALEPAPPNPRTGIQVVLGKLYIRDSRIEYVQGGGDKAFKLQMDGVDVKLRDLAFPARPGRAEVYVTGHISDKAEYLPGSRVDFRGWVDIIAADMDGVLKVIGQDDEVLLMAYPKAKNNVLVVTGNLQLQSILAAGVPKEKIEGSVRDQIVAVLRKQGLGIATEFSFVTQLNNFSINDIKIKGTVIQEEHPPAAL